MRRKGLGYGRGKGYFNLIPNYDSYVHQLSAKGIKSSSPKVLNLKRYSGTWYQQSAFPVWFQKGCSDVQAMYKVRDDGNIDVINSCTKEGKQSSSIGIARPVTKDNKNLKVSFGFPFFEGDYKIEYVDSGYNHAIVGHPKKKYLWILSREKKIPISKYKQLVKIAENKGYDVEKLLVS